MFAIRRSTAIGMALFAWTGAEAQEAVVDEILVTAQKRAQSLQDVPISITAFGAEALDALGAQSMGDLDSFTPGLSVNDSSVTQPRFAMRGVATDDFGIGTEPAVGIFIDGVYVGRSGSALVFFNDVERVEVLKGPQGTLFGRNTSAGAISITTNRPTTDALEANATLRLGNYSKRRIDGMVNVPLTDRLAVRATGVVNRRDGYLHDAVTGEDYEREDNWSARLALRFQPTDGTDMLLSYDHDHTEKDGPAAVGISPFALSRSPDGPFANDVIGGSREARRLHAVTFNVTQELGDIDFTSISAYREFRTNNREDEDGTNLPAHYLDTENIERNRSFYQELRLAQEGERLTWVLGASYFKEHGNQTSQVNALSTSIDTLLGVAVGLPLFSILEGIGGLPVMGHPWREEMVNSTRNESWALFGDMTFAAAPELNLTAGLRYTRDRKRFTWFNGPFSSPGLEAVSAPGALYNAILGAPLFPDEAMIDVATFFGLVVGSDIIFDSGALEGVEVSRRASFSDFSPRFVVDYTPMPGLMLFASASRGYKAGGFNSVQINSFFEPESVWNFEGGFKSELMEKRLRLNASVYRFTYKNRQSLSLESVDGSGLPQYVTSSGDSTATGVDFETSFAVAPGFQLSAVGAFIDSKWDNRIEQGVDVSGQPTGEPSFRAVLSARFDREVGSIGNLFADASYSFTSKQRINDATRASDAALENDPVFGELVDFSQLKKLRASREIVNARGGWRSANDKVSVSIFAENLFDVRTPRSLNLISAHTLGTPYVRMDRPRFWGVEAGVRF